MQIVANVGKLLCLFAVMLLASSFPARAQTNTKYEVTGFRDAKFGMTEREVRTVVTKSFSVRDADIKTSPNVIEGTNLLTVKVPTLEPAPGPANITYIFGNKSKRLIQINLIWGEEATNPPTDANTMVGAGTRLGRYFEGFTWRKDGAKAGIPVGDNTVVLFAGEDDKKGAVRVLVDGVKYQMNKDGNQTTSPDPKGPPKLIVNYIADRENPDVARIENGKF
jgi:hypothetical protein